MIDSSLRSARPENKKLILGLACLAQFMVVLDLAIVNVALPSMRDTLHLSTSGMQWVVNAYTLAFAGLLLLGGRAADIFGHRRVFLLGMGLFTGASLVGGMATEGSILIIARALQGVGGAVIAPATLTILTTTFTDPKERAHAMGVWSACAGAGGAAGAILGGLLTDLLNWRWIFFINIPIGIVAAVSAQRLLHARNERHANSLDVPGAVLVTGGLISVVYGIVGAEQHPWISWHTVPYFVLGVALLGLFTLHEAKFAREPLMPLSLWKARSLTMANATLFFMAMGLFSSWFFLSLFLQNVHGFSPMKTGFAFLPQTLAIIAGSQIAPRLMRRIPARNIVMTGSFLSAIGMGWLSQIDASASYWSSVFAPGVLTTFGMGLTMTPLASVAMSSVPRQLAGLASGVFNTSRQVGAALGLAVLATIAAERTSHLTSSHSAVDATTGGYGLALGLGGVAIAIGTLLATTLPGKPADATEPSPVAKVAAELAPEV
jgi:EmrB/QacA subfamily drug resistance transporter